jgi:predicted metal-dependent HD superfamily phosphohydrolase
MALDSCWQAAWDAAGLTAPGGVLEDLYRRYDDPQRHYHTRVHLEECFSHFELIRARCENPAAVMLALWFHDAVYNSRAADNEMQSARLADAVLAEAGAGEALRAQVRRLIDVTRHTAAPVTADEIVMVDIDLAIFAAPFARFWQYEEEVREEYSWMDEWKWREGRGALLRGFLRRPHLFGTSEFRARFETQARDNIDASLARLAE